MLRKQHCIRHSGEGGLGYLFHILGRGHTAIPGTPDPPCLLWRAAQLTIPPYCYPISIDRLPDQGRLKWIPPALPVHSAHFLAGSSRVPTSGEGHDFWSGTLYCLRELQPGVL